jgi:hypothetical protein
VVDNILIQDDEGRVSKSEQIDDAFLPRHLNSTPCFSVVHVAQVFFVVFCR